MVQQLVVNGLIAGCIYALVALGFALIYRTIRFFHFAHGAVITLGGYAAYTARNALGGPMWVGIVFGALAASVLGLAIDCLVYRPLRRRKAPDLVFLIASFGVFLFVQNAIQLAYGPGILSLKTGPISKGHDLLGAIVTDAQIVVIVTTVLLTAILWALLRFTDLGRRMRAVADDSLGASVIGINPKSVIVASFGIGSALGGVAGALVGWETNLEPTMGLTLILKGIVASIVGGIVSIPGAIMGAILIGLIESLVAWTLGAQWQDLVTFAVLVGFLLLRPTGIAGLARER